MLGVANLAICRAAYYFPVGYVASSVGLVLTKHPNGYDASVSELKAISLEDPFHLRVLPASSLANSKVEAILQEVQTSLAGLMLADAFMRELLDANYPSLEREENAEKSDDAIVYANTAGMNGNDDGNEPHAIVAKDSSATRLA